MDVSIVVPVFNEWETVRPLRDGIEAALGGRYKYQIIFVDDCSTDSTKIMLEGMPREFGNVVVIRMGMRRGKSDALAEGFRNVFGGGRYVITMDADMQDDPADLPKFIEALDRFDADIIVGWRKNRRDPWHKKLLSGVYNGLAKKLFNLRIHDMNCGYKAYRREVLERVKVYGDMHRYFPIFALAEGFKVGEVFVDHKPRLHGKSKYGFSRTLTGLLDLMTITYLMKFGEKPLHLFGSLAAAIGALGMGVGAYLLYIKYVGNASLIPAHLPMLLLAITLSLVGLLLFAMGFLAEMIVWRTEKIDYIPLMR